MRLQRNKKTGDYRADLGDGQFVPVRVQKNKITGETRIVAGNKVYPYEGAALEDNASNYGRAFYPEKPISPEGAPLLARFAIGSADNDETKLARAKDYLGDSVRQEPGGELSFISPKTGERIAINMYLDRLLYTDELKAKDESNESSDQ